MPRIGTLAALILLSLAACGPESARTSGDSAGGGEGSTADSTDDGHSEADDGTTGATGSTSGAETTTTTGAVDVTCAEAAVCVAAECPLSLWYEDTFLSPDEMEAAIACAIEKCGAMDHDEGEDAMWAGWDFFSCNDDSDEHDNDHYNPHDTGEDGTAD